MFNFGGIKLIFDMFRCCCRIDYVSKIDFKV